MANKDFTTAQGSPETALVSTLSYPDIRHLQQNTMYFCHWSRHRQYCERHSYECFFVVDAHAGMSNGTPSEWRRTINEDPFHVAPHWFKVFVLRMVLPKFAVVILVDADTLIQHFDLPFEPLLEIAGERWWILEDKKGITSHTIILKNNPLSRGMVEHLWDLRHVCPSCPFGEQCAVHLIIHELMLDWALQNGRTHFTIPSDKGLSCCNPALHCEYPTADVNDRNLNHSWSVQGCTWSWWFQLGPQALKATHKHMYWKSSPETAKNDPPLNVRHPVKHQQRCMDVNLKYNKQFPEDPGRISIEELRRILQARSDYDPTPVSWPFDARAADVDVGIEFAERQPRWKARYCAVFRA
jgi:hypothetical protein